jgi:hypothetical protein
MASASPRTDPADVSPFLCPAVLCLYAVALPEKISQLHRLGGVYTTAAPYPYAQAGGAHDDHDHKGGRDGNLQGNHSVGPHHALSHQLSPVLEGNEAEHAVRGQKAGSQLRTSTRQATSTTAVEKPPHRVSVVSVCGSEFS